MANTHNAFNEYHDNIRLTDAKTTSLRTSRDALRKTIKDNFNNKNRNTPKFCWQGSFAMKTTVNPLESDYDIDDGVYLQGYNAIEMADWETADTVHRWVLDAVDDQTQKDSINKNTCIRVIYAAGYHIDLPIYITKDDVAYLAHRSKGWIESDPKAFKNWFLEHIKAEGEQLRRVVRYLKAWKDYEELDLKGVEITILAAENFCAYENRDDRALRDTLNKIINALESEYACKKPVSPNDDLFENHSETKKNSIISALKTLRDVLSRAITMNSLNSATKSINECFGSRFPIKDDDDTDCAAKSYQASSAPGVLKSDGRSGSSYYTLL